MVSILSWFQESETTKYTLSKIEIRRQKLMDAFEEAKNEHFASIRINIGHPSYATQLADLCARESARLVRFFAWSFFQI